MATIKAILVRSDDGSFTAVYDALEVCEGDNGENKVLAVPKTASVSKLPDRMLGNGLVTKGLPGPLRKALGNETLLSLRELEAGRVYAIERAAAAVKPSEEAEKPRKAAK